MKKNLILILAIITIFSNTVASGNELKTIEVERASDIWLSYKERRDSFAVEVNFKSQPILPKLYVSQLDGGDYATNYKNAQISVLRPEVFLNWNNYLGSIGIGYSTGSGTVKEAVGSDTYSLSLTETLMMVKIGFNNFLNEPYIVPYFSSGTVNLTYTEKNESIEKTGTITGTTTIVGLQIQLNAIDDGAFLSANKSFGLENTFIDLFFQQIAAPKTDSTPDFTSESIIGYGFSLEF